MPDDTDILGLPLILPSQAQKHVTHNEALAVLDVVVQLAVITRNQTVPPALAGIGDRHIVPAGGTLQWAGKDGQVAVMTETGWQFHVPNAGWQAQVLSEGQTAVFDGVSWVVPSEGAATFAQLGVSAMPDATNRLSVSSPATLLNHAGAGHQLKLNKAAPGDTASLLFQTGFSGRAEMGTTGSDAFEIKVSANGTVFQTALTADGASGEVAFPSGIALSDGTAAQPALRFVADGDTGLVRSGANGLGLVAGGAVRAQVLASALQVDVPLTGTAVTQSLTDTTAGRLTKVRDFGLGGGTASFPETVVPDLDATTLPAGFFQTTSATTGVFPAAESLFGQGIVFRYDQNNFTQVWMSALSDTLYTRRYRSTDAVPWSPWRPLFSRHNILGAVSQTAGQPTGRVIERGSNANGEFVRFADGTLVCTRTNLSAANANVASGALFRSSANVSWTYPAAFAVAPAVSGDVDDADSWLVTAGAPTVTSVALRAMASVTKASALTLRATAIGRWF